MLAQRGLRDRDARHEPLAGSAVDRTAQPGRARIARLPEDGVDPGEELRRLERLRDVVGGPAGEPADLVHDLAASREEDHRDRRRGGVALDAKAHVVTIRVGEHHVQKHEVRQQLLDKLDAAPPVVGDGYDHSVRLQAALEHVGGRLVVFNDYHARRRCIRADRFLYCLHFFFVFFVPSVSPRSQRIATMNFDGRSSRVFSLR